MIHLIIQPSATTPLGNTNKLADVTGEDYSKDKDYSNTSIGAIEDPRFNFIHTQKKFCLTFPLKS